MPEGVVGHYQLIRRLGQGGMGEIWLARDTRLTRQVALKFLPPQLEHDAVLRRRLLGEARAASALNHPNVCVIHEVAEADAEGQRPYIVMEYIEGSMLDARIRQGSVPIPDIVSIGLQVADALEAAHARGIVHRDIKPSNISVNARGIVKVLDFGLAKRTRPEEFEGDDAPTEVHTKTGSLLGTPSYMSPEQALGSPVDGRSDLFSLGVVLYKLTTGELPFAGGNLGEVLDKILHQQPRPISRLNYDAPAELERIIRKCLEKDPGRRFQEARELRVDLRNLLRDLEKAGGGQEPAVPEPVATRSASAAPAEASPPPTPEEVTRSDIFINCAQLDDRPLVVGQPGWVSQFQRNLEIRLQRLSGEEVQVRSYPLPPGTAHVDERLLASLPEAKTMVSVLSPPFMKSDGCRQELESFYRGAERSGNLVVESRPRLFKVLKSPIDPEDVPLELSQVFSRLMAFEFFERDPETGRVREFDEALGELARQRYHERVYDLAHEISRVLKGFKNRAVGPVTAKADGALKGKSIFLAVTTSDVQPQRDQMRRVLVELGHEVLPTQPLPTIASELESAVRSYLRDCDTAIHLIGERYGLVPEDAAQSVVALQNQWAAEQSRQSGLERVIWMPRGLQLADPRQAEFVRNLARDPQLHAGAEIIADTLENLKGVLEERWNRAQRTEVAKPARPGQGPPRVYLICDRSDEAAVEPLEDFLYEQGIEVCLPAFEMASEAEVQEAHMNNLRDCHGVLVFYGLASRSWVDIKVRDLAKASAYREARPIEARAVYLAPPFDRRKERYRTLSAQLIKQEGAFDGAALGAFVSQLKALI